jgi:hypothetical protein
MGQIQGSGVFVWTERTKAKTPDPFEFIVEHNLMKMAPPKNFDNLIELEHFSTWCIAIATVVEVTLAILGSDCVECDVDRLDYCVEGAGGRFS